MDYNGLKVLVTGADGFIGSHLTEKLVQRGAKVTALCLYNSFDQHGWLERPARQIVAASSRSCAVTSAMRPSCAGSRRDRRSSFTSPRSSPFRIPTPAAQCYAETNVLGTLNVLEAARESGAMRVVHTSTSEVYGTALTMPISESHPLQGQSPYSASKIGADMMAEAFARSFELPVAILRPFNTFGPRQSERAIIPTIIRQALDPTCNAIRTGDTSPLRDFTFVEDTAEAFLAIGVAPNIQFGRPLQCGKRQGGQRQGHHRSRHAIHQLPAAGQGRIRNECAPRVPRCAPSSPTADASTRIRAGAPISTCAKGSNEPSHGGASDWPEAWCVAKPGS